MRTPSPLRRLLIWFLRSRWFFLIIGYFLGAGQAPRPVEPAPLSPVSVQEQTFAISLAAPTVAPVVALPQPVTSLRVHFIDVGQGDSFLIQSADGTDVLLDGGPQNGAALAYLQRLGITHLDALILSHPHADHVGGLVQVMPALSAGAVWTSGASHTTYVFEQFIDLIDANAVPYYEATTGSTITVGSLNFEVLYGEPYNANLNDTSLVLRLDYGETSMLFTGDAEAPIEAHLLASIRERLDVDVLKIGHHASDSSSTPNFIAAISPEVAIYSAGAGNSHGHPRRSVLNTVARSGATIYGTDIHGSIILETDGTTYTVNTSTTVPPVLTDGVQSMKATGVLPVAAATVSGITAYNGDRDCGSFATHKDAQIFFVDTGGPQADPHGLDRDNDGIACESLP